MFCEEWLRGVRAGGFDFEQFVGSDSQTAFAQAEPFQAARLRALAYGYHLLWWTQTVNEYIVEAIEQQFVAPLRSPHGGRSRTFRRSGKRDAVLVSRQAAERIVMEHKTTSMDISPGSTYLQQLALDSQVSAYLDIDGTGGLCLYDVVRKPALQPRRAVETVIMTKGRRCKCDIGCGKCDGGWKERPRPRKGQQLTDETPEEFEARCLEAIASDPRKYYQRVTVARTERDLAEHRADDWALALRVRDAMASDDWPRNTHACQRFGRLCAYYGVCSGSDTLDSPRFMSTDTHQELDVDSGQETLGFDGA